MSKFSKHAFLGLAAALFSFSALALDLDSARASGLVNENPDGYISANANATGEVQALVRTVNQQRKAAYLEISKKNGQPLDVVEKLAAAKIQEKLGGK